MEKTIEWLREEREKQSALFWDRKAKFTFYLLSLPFAMLAVAVSSFDPMRSPSWITSVLEISAWILLLLAGTSGLISRWGEMKSAQLSSVRLSGQLSREQHPATKDLIASESWRKQEKKHFSELERAMNAESKGQRALIILLPTGALLWIIGRASSALCLL